MSPSGSDPLARPSVALACGSVETVAAVATSWQPVQTPRREGDLMADIACNIAVVVPLPAAFGRPFPGGSKGARMTRMDGAVCSTSIAGKQVHFFVTNEHDEIQYHHVAGRFYETEELTIIAQFFPRGGVFVDIGANVGNHSIYVCNYLEPLQVVAIEPNPVVIPILKINLALNGLLPLVDLSHLGGRALRRAGPGGGARAGQ
jgi:hypothetical protein